MSHASRIFDADARAELMAEVEDARAAVQVAEEQRAIAKRRYRCAPPGTRVDRHKAFLAATQELLKAEGRFGRLKREAGLK